MEIEMREKRDFIVVGGGASGMAAAVAASCSGERVLLLEKSSSLGKKISASGNGRCNLMNTLDPVYYGDTDFAARVLRLFGRKDLERFWGGLGLCLCEEEEGRVYPATFQASSVVDALKTGLKSGGVETMLQAPVLRVRKEGGMFCAETGQGTFFAERILIASGGAASPKLGGSSSGYSILASFGHHIVPPSPTLCPLTTDRKSISGLSGIRTRCRLSLYNRAHELLHSEKGEILFTDYGISGICAMQCARFTEEGCTAELDLAGRIFPDAPALTEYLRRRREKVGIFPPETILTGFLMPRLAFAVLKQAGIETRNRTVGDLSDAELASAGCTAYRYTLQITGTKGLDESQATSGGAECREFIPETMESRIVKGLHASGELLNVDGGCGGFNLMFAFSSGILAGLNGRRV